MSSQATLLTKALTEYNNVISGLTTEERELGLTTEMKKRLNTALGKLRASSVAVNQAIEKAENDYQEEASKHEGEQDHMEATRANLEEELITFKACYKIPTLITNGTVQLKEGRQPAQKRLLETFKEVIRKKAMSSCEEITIPEQKVIVPLEAQQRIRALHMSSQSLMSLKNLNYRPSRLAVSSAPEMHHHLRHLSTNLATFSKAVESAGVKNVSISLVTDPDDVSKVIFIINEAIHVEIRVHSSSATDDYLVAAITTKSSEGASSYSCDIGDKFFNLIPGGGTTKCSLSEDSSSIKTSDLSKKYYKYVWLECLYSIPKWGSASNLPTDSPGDLVLSHGQLRLYCTVEEVVFLLLERFHIVSKLGDEIISRRTTVSESGLTVLTSKASIFYPNNFPYSPISITVENDIVKSAHLNFYFGCQPSSVKGEPPARPFLPSDILEELEKGDKIGSLPETAANSIVNVAWTPTGAVRYEFVDGNWVRVVK